jgi:hypothetical protein
MSNILKKLRRLLAPPADFVIDLEDAGRRFEKFARLFEYERVEFERKFCKNVTAALDIDAFPPWMKRWRKRPEVKSVLSKTIFSEKPGPFLVPERFLLVMKTSRLRHVLQSSKAWTIVVCTTIGEYPVNRYSFVASPVLSQIVGDNPETRRIELGIDDDIQSVAKFLLFEKIQIKQDNLDFLHEVGMMLDLRPLTAMTTKYRVRRLGKNYTID